MEIAVRMFPENETANLNAAITRLNAGDADGAKAISRQGRNQCRAQNARGVYEMLKGNGEASSLLSGAGSQGWCCFCKRKFTESIKLYILSV